MSSKFPFPNIVSHQDNQLFIIPIFRNEIRRCVFQMLSPETG